MHFPVVLDVGPWHIDAHTMCEVCAYLIGFQLYRRSRAQSGDVLGSSARWSVIVAAAVGAAIGCRLLAALEYPPQTLRVLTDLRLLLNGKTIVGGLIGGLIAVELAKRWNGIEVRTGDLFAVPLAVGIAIGRLGCFFAGLTDGTYGTPTRLWTGVDFGDGVSRHPTQLYELVFLTVLALVLTRIPATVGASGRTALWQNGDQFRAFMFAYFAFRLAIDAIKPLPAFRVFGLTTIQLASVVMLAYYVPDLWRVVVASRAQRVSPRYA